MRVKCAAARKEAWQKERAGYSTCHHRLERGLRRSSFDSSFNDSSSVFIYEEKNRGRKTRERTIQETRTRFEVLFTIYSIKPRKRIETRISSRNIDFFRSKKSHISFVLVRDIWSNVIIGRASRKKWERKSHGRRARDTRDTQTVSEKSSAPK